MPNSQLYNEKELLLRVADGDQQAFAGIVQHYTRIIYPMLLSYLKDAGQAEEITQDIFMRVWKNKERLPGMDNFAGYVYVIARNRANSALKERLSHASTAAIDTLYTLSTPPAASLELKELADVLYKAIDALPPRRKEVFMLSRMENLTYEAIAARLNISRSAVRQHMVEALVFLRHYLKERMGIIVSGLLWIWFFFA